MGVATKKFPNCSLSVFVRHHLIPLQKPLHVHSAELLFQRQAVRVEGAGLHRAWLCVSETHEHSASFGHIGRVPRTQFAHVKRRVTLQVVGLVLRGVSESLGHV